MVLVQPQNATVLLGENGTFSCQLDNMNNAIEWEVFFPSGTSLEFPAILNENASRRIALMHNIFITSEVEDQKPVSTFTLTSNMTNNLTQIQCSEMIPGDVPKKTGLVFLRVKSKQCVQIIIFA